jgi:drug/metabolite transporter (DMT)-like permease
LFSFLWAALLAVVMIPYYMIGIKVLSLGSLAIYSMFMMLGGMLVPFFYGILFLHEKISLGKIFGSVLLTVFIVLQAIWQTPVEGEGGASTSQKSGKRTKWLFFALCLVIFFINGMTGVIAKAHQIGGERAIGEVSFTVLSCGVTALISAVMIPLQFIKANKKEQVAQIQSTFQWKPLLAMIAIGAAAYTGSFLHLKAAAKVPASVQFPLVSGGVIVLSALVSALIFREKISKKEWISVAGAFASTFLFVF